MAIKLIKITLQKYPGKFQAIQKLFARDKYSFNICKYILINLGKTNEK